MERKVIECAFNLKQVTETGQFEGHAAVFGNVDLQGDRIKRGAFAETLEEDKGKWPIFMAHNTGRPVGFSTHAEEDSKGLYVVGEFTMDSDEGRNAYASVRHAQRVGQRYGLSIGYAIRGENGVSFDETTSVRTLKNLTVYEFSLAGVPANSRARIASVKELGECKTVREVEAWLRERGATHDDARTMISVCRLERDVNAGGDLERDVKDAEGRAAQEFMSWVAREYVSL